MICLQLIISFAGNNDAKAVSSKLPAGCLISPHVAHGWSWLWDPWHNSNWDDTFDLVHSSIAAPNSTSYVAQSRSYMGL